MRFDEFVDGKINKISSEVVVACETNLMIIHRWLHQKLIAIINKVIFRYQNARYMIVETYLNGGGTGGAACCWAAKGLDTDPPIESGPRPMAEC